jgi:hypothetical protein
MTSQPIPGERKADLAGTAATRYAQSARILADPFNPWPEPDQPLTDRDRVASLLCGLMHHADYSRVSFGDALRAAREEYRQERGTYVPGDAVRLRDNGVGPDALGDVFTATGTGEVLRSRPGEPMHYEVDFITYREWIPEPDLTSGPSFPAVITSAGTITSAHEAREELVATAAGIEVSFRRRWTQRPQALDDLRELATALCGWSGISRDDLFDQLDSEIQGVIRPYDTPQPAGPASLTTTCFPHPATRAAALPEPRDGTAERTARPPLDQQPRRRAGGLS